jgi:transposase
MGISIEMIRRKYEGIKEALTERSRRLWAVAEANAIGHGGVTMVHKATGISRQTIHKGIHELESGVTIPSDRIRAHGAGRKKITVREPGINEALAKLVESSTRGDPERILLWTIKSLRELAKELIQQGYRTSYMTVRRLLKRMGFSMQSNRKTKEGADHPDRNAQFEYIATKSNKFMGANVPVISVDTKKKELVGDYKNSGKTWRNKGNPEKVNVHDFPDPSLGKAIPYGIYDLINNCGWVNVGITSDTAEFAVNSIMGWWMKMGKGHFPHAKKIMITADGGGSNGYRNRLWKVSLQEFSNKTGLEIHVSHFPPGTSKWNKIEHRLFSFISKRWAGIPLRDHATIISLIGSTSTSKGLRVHAKIDNRKYVTGKKITDEQMEKLNMIRDTFHGDWNYIIKPNR